MLQKAMHIMKKGYAVQKKSVFIFLLKVDKSVDR